MSKLALAMITKGDEGEALDRCLASVAKWVDGIFVTITTEDKGASKIVEKYGGTAFHVPGTFHRVIKKEEVEWLEEFLNWKPKVKEGDKLFMFDEARNYSFEQVPEEYDWMFWIDTDDVLRGGHNFKRLIKEAEENDIDAIFANYLYRVDADESGRVKAVVIEHLRERLVRRGVHKWIAPIHETLIAQRPARHVDSKDFDVVHLADISPEGDNARTQRNIRTLEILIHDTQGKDPRPIYYLAKTHFDLGNVLPDFEKETTEQEHFNRAWHLMEIYLHGSDDQDNKNKSGWAEERAQCWDYMAEISKKRGHLNRAIKCNFNAMIEDPKFPQFYISAAHTYAMRQEWDRAKHWLALGLSIDMPNTTLVGNPKDLQARAHEVAYHVALSENNLNSALESARALAELKPEDPNMQNRLLQMEQLFVQREVTKSFMDLANHLKQYQDTVKLKSLVNAAPFIIENNPFVENLRQEISPPKKWEDNEIAIYCGPGFTVWSPEKLKNPKGSFMGGSEEAVVYVSNELRDLGWNVTVYNECGDDEGDHDGVKYESYHKFNRKDDFNILISWRQPQLADIDLSVKKLYIWCHDIQNPLDYTPERLEKIHKVMVLSPWHRTNIPNVPDEKIFLTGNGVTL